MRVASRSREPIESSQLRIRRPSVLLLPLVLALLSGTALAQSPKMPPANKLCRYCHKKPDIIGSKDGVEMSMHVDFSRYGESVHGKLACISCHSDIDIEDIPHEDDLKPATCIPCHEEQVTKQGESRHGQARP